MQGYVDLNFEFKNFIKFEQFKVESEQSGKWNVYLLKDHKNVMKFQSKKNKLIKNKK